MRLNLNDQTAWEYIPSMQEARYASSSCSLGDNLYVFCGFNDQAGERQSIEKLRVTESVSEQRK